MRQVTTTFYHIDRMADKDGGKIQRGLVHKEASLLLTFDNRRTLYALLGTFRDNTKNLAFVFASTSGLSSWS